jgi:predicted secreted protein
MMRIAMVIALVATGCSRASTPVGGGGGAADAEPIAHADADATLQASAPVTASAVADASAAPQAHDVDDGGAHAVLVDETGDGKTFDLAVGQRLVVKLGANPTTGFDWAVTKAPAALGAPEMSYTPGGTQMGAPGTRKLVWTLKIALPAGDQAVELGYARSFEKGVAPFKTFKFKVRAAH